MSFYRTPRDRKSPTPLAMAKATPNGTKNSFLLPSPAELLRNHKGDSLWLWAVVLASMPGTSEVSKDYRELSAAITREYLEQIGAQALLLTKWTARMEDCSTIIHSCLSSRPPAAPFVDRS